MSILIKGMEMPKDCISCPFCDYEQGLCLAANDMDTAPRTIGKRHDDCPLVSVSPHGRLIDADAIILPQGFFGRVNNVPIFYRWLKALPTIIEEEEE